MKYRQSFSRTLKKVSTFLSPFLWFVVGFGIAGLLLTFGTTIYLQNAYKDKIIPGVFVDNLYVGDKKKSDVERIFNEKNKRIHSTVFSIFYNDTVATISAEELHIGYNTQLIADQAMAIGKTSNLISNVMTIVDSYLNGSTVKTSYTFDEQILKQRLADIQKEIYVEPTDAQFTVSNNRVTAFRQSTNGQTIDYEKLTKTFSQHFDRIIKEEKTQTISIEVPIQVLLPKVTTEKANNLGVVEVIGEGKSYFAGSIPNRIHNISLAASKLNGVLVAPNEIFSFNKTIGDVSKYTGYKQAYVIQNGKTVLGDGGGVCQVSTTLFRAVLNTGLPVEERHAHAYRVGYYEQHSAPGIDAAMYVPTVDFKFKNDTDHHILIQTYLDPTEMSLTFTLYGTKDGREVSMTQPVITNSVPAPEPMYQDDPSLPVGVEQQVEYAAAGAVVTFSRTVTKNGEVHLSDTYTTRYAPWRAVYLRGTKEG